MALGALSISPGMTPLSTGGVKGGFGAPIIISPPKGGLKKDNENQEELVDIGKRLLEAISGQDQRGGNQPRPKLTASQKAESRDKKIGKSDVKSDLAEDRKIMTDTLKDAFGGVDGKEGMKMSLKMFLLATGLIILFKYSDQISKFLGPVLGFMKNTLIPGLTSLFKVFVKNPLGIAPFVVAASLGLKRISRFFKSLTGTFKFLMAATKDGGKLTKGLTQGFSKSQKAIAGFVNGIRSLFPPLNALGKTSKTTSALGKLVSGSMKVFSSFMKGIRFVFGIFGKLSGFSKVFGVALKFAKLIPGLGQIVMLIQGIVGAVTGFIDGFKSGGILGGLMGALIGVWDAIVGSFANLIKDLVAWFLGVLGFDKAAEFFSGLDFSFEGIKAGFFFIVDKIMGAFNALVDGAKGMANFVIRGINKIRTRIGLEPYEEFELSGEKKAREAKEAEAEGTVMNDEQRQSGGGTPLPSVVSGEVQIGQDPTLPAVISGEVATGRDPIDDFNMDEPATGDNVFGMSDRNKKYAIAERIREENPDMKGGDAARLAKAEFEKTKALKEAQAESTAGGAGVVVVNNTNNNSTNNNSSSTQQMAGMLGSDHTDPTQDLLSKANI